MTEPSFRFDDQWDALLGWLPAAFDLEETAHRSGALSRPRGVRTASSLLRLALVYSEPGSSLRTTCGWALQTDVATLSGPALLNRLSNAATWLGSLVQALLNDVTHVPVWGQINRRLCSVDATTLSEPGAQGTTWRLHVAFDLTSGKVDQVSLTNAHGAESLRRFACRPGDILLADRGYAKAGDLRPIVEAGADFIVRVGWNALRLMNNDGSIFDLFGQLARVRAGCAAVPVHLDAPGGGRLALRLVISRKSNAEALKSQDKAIKDAKKHGRTVDPRTLEAAKYVLLLTSLLDDPYSAEVVSNYYRFRWQIELCFKRWKSLGGLDQLPAKGQDLAKAWIYARLIMLLLAERATGLEPDSPPSADAIG